MFNLRAKKLYKFILTLGFGLCFFITGCQNPLDTVLDEPSMGLDNERPASYLPTNLVATHGKYREIELSWEPSDNAMRYYIYQSTTPFSNFQQIGETTADENSYTVSAKSSALFYYKVTAVTSRGEETIPSNTAMGTTLSTPVISDIVSETESGFITVKWYMENSQYYAAGSVAYSVICFDKGGAEVARSELITDAQADRATFKGLEPKTTYWFEVEVYNMSDQSKTEKSGKLDAETARRMRPAAPENLSATQGEYSEKIVISFTKPAMVDVKVGSDFKETPLDFHVERRETYPYATSFVNITDSLTDKDKLTHTGDYENYIVGETVTVADTNAHRGRRYEYRVRSYTHNTSTTTEYSMAVAEGWAVPTMVYKMSRSDYEKDANGDHKAVTLFGTLEFDAFGKDDNYSYDLSYDFYAKQEDGVFPSSPTKPNEPILSGASRAELESYKMPLVLPRDNGKYQFKVSATHKTSGWKGDVQATRSEVVSDKVVFSIQNLNVEDGYPDKFIVSWTAEESVKYVLSHKKVGASDFTAVEGQLEGNGDYKYTFNATSGDKYQFRVEAIDGDSKDTETYSTLGTPEVRFEEDKAQMDKITVRWNPVEKATDYEVYYSFKTPYQMIDPSATTMRDGKLMSFEDIITIDKVSYETDNRAEYVHTFEKPAGYDNMLFAGSPITVHVKAINEDRGNVFTRGTKDTHVVGPYLATNGATASVAEVADKITYSWKKVPGAKGYYISRIRYNVSNNPTEENTIRDSDIEVVYYYDESKNELSVPALELSSSEIKSKSVAGVNLSGDTFTLTDNYKPQSTDATSAFYREQDRLAWGYPFRYQVFPVTEDTGFERTSEEKCILGDKVTYIDTTKEANYKTGSALGWGIDVTASKATHENHVDLKWIKPYTKGAANSDEIKPTIWRRRYNSDSDWGPIQISTLTKDTDNYKLARFSTETKVDETDFQAFDYVVKYINGSSDGLPPKQAYIDESKDSDPTKEAKNKGYFFSIEINTNRITGQDQYEEALYIAPWDYTERQNGPDKYIVRLKNKNLSKDYYTIATISNPKNFNSLVWNETTVTSPSENIWIDTKNNIEKRTVGNVLLLKPKFDPNDTHNDLLKVLRDYKHYYQVLATRRDSSGGEVQAEPEVFASRQITLKEFTKVTLVGISTGLDRARSRNGEGQDIIPAKESGQPVKQDGKTTLTSKSEGGWIGSTTIDHNFNGYDALHIPQSLEEEVSAVKITGNLYGRGPVDGWARNYYNKNGTKGDEWMDIEYYGYQDNNGRNMKGQIFFIGRDNGEGDRVSRNGGQIKLKYNGSDEQTFDVTSNGFFILPFMSDTDYRRTKDYSNWR